MKESSLTGKMISYLRDRLGLTQVELADKLGVSEGSVRNYEKEARVDRKERVIIPMIFDWALAAIAAKLRPYSETIKKGDKQ
jgi:transcriptional regulator with XRE-family HTH domain